MKLNGLPVPKLLLELIEQGRWKRPADTAILRQITGSKRADEFVFLDTDGMQRETMVEHLMKNDEVAQIYGLASSTRTNAPITDHISTAVMFAGLKKLFGPKAEMLGDPVFTQDGRAIEKWKLFKIPREAADG